MVTVAVRKKDPIPSHLVPFRRSHGRLTHLPILVQWTNIWLGSMKRMRVAVWAWKRHPSVWLPWQLEPAGTGLTDAYHVIACHYWAPCSCC